MNQPQETSAAPDTAQLRRYYASLDAYADIRLVTLGDGAERGVRMLQLRSGGGLDLDVVVDRSFDIGRLAIGGQTVSWHTPNGYRAPWLIDPFGDGGHGFLRGISGFLATCGFDHIRQPDTDEAGGSGVYPTDRIDYPLHGLGAHQPARLIGYGVEENAAHPFLWCAGEVTQSIVFGGALRLTRRIEVPLGGRTASIRDRVQNIGPQTMPHMMLYHFNVGHPLIGPGTRLSTGDAPRVWSNGCGDAREPFGEPVDQGEQELSVYKLVGERAEVVLHNPENGLSLTVGFDVASLPYLQLLRLRGAGHYAMGIEPCTGFHRSRKDARASGEIDGLAPGQWRDYAIDVSLSGPGDLADRDV